MFVNSLTIGTTTAAIYLDNGGARVTVYENGGSKPVISFDQHYDTLTAARQAREDMKITLGKKK
jgi:hypothetical protein